MNKLIVFTRYPEIGTTKTRLIPALGDENAMQLQKCMTEDTLTLCNRLALLDLFDIEVRFTGANSDLMRGWLGSSPRFVNQGKGSLGHRLESAFCHAFKAEYHKDRNRNKFPIYLNVSLRGFAKQSPCPCHEIASSGTPRNDTFGEVISMTILR